MRSPPTTTGLCQCAAPVPLDAARSRLDSRRVGRVPVDVGRDLARSAKAEHLECSALDGTNVELLFERVATRLRECGLDGGRTSRGGLSVSVSGSSQGGRGVISTAGCC